MIYFLFKCIDFQNYKPDLLKLSKKISQLVSRATLSAVSAGPPLISSRTMVVEAEGRPEIGAKTTSNEGLNGTLDVAYLTFGGKRYKPAVVDVVE